MTPPRSRAGWIRWTVAWLAASVLFVPAAREFLSRGVPEVLFTGDGAVLELGTFRALHGVQLLGPYSRFGWNHPGPLYFYLAAPFYAAFHERGPALNVFALAVAYGSILGVVLVAARLQGIVFSLMVAALVGSYALVGTPFLVGNEWNPIVPILPLALATFIAAAIGRGHAALWPALAFLASAIAQTHIGFAPVLLALTLLAAASGWRTKRRPRGGIWIATVAVLAACWLLPIVDVAAHPPGNLVAIARFFVPKHWSEHSWRQAIGVVNQQMAVLPNAIFRVVHVRPVTAPRLDAILLAAQVIALAFLATSSRDTVARSFSRLALVELAAAVFAVRAIRGDIEFYLVAWISVVGLTVFAALASAVLDIGNGFLGEVTTAVAGCLVAVGVTACALTLPVARSPVVRAPDANAEAIARQTDHYVETASGIGRPMIRVSSMTTWPTAAATLLFLTKRGVTVSATGDLLRIVGEGFAPDPDARAELVFDRAEAPVPAGAVPVAKAGQVAVYRQN